MTDFATIGRLVGSKSVNGDHMKRFVSCALFCMAMLGVGSTPAFADKIPVPDGPVILTISGDIDTANVDGTVQFDRMTLADLDKSLIETTTIWTDGRHTFQGVSLHILTELLGVSDGTLLSTAINDYTVEIPVSDAVPDGPIIAYKMDGDEMSVRDKGPLWVVYPYDSSPDYRTAVIHARSIWQLDRIEVVK